MRRVRVSLPHGARYRYQDLLHDALINAWVASGAAAEEVIGAEARPWTFAWLGGRRGDENLVHTLVISTPDPVLGERLSGLDPSAIRCARAMTGESVDFSGAAVREEADSVPPKEGSLGLLMLSPLLLSTKQAGKRIWQRRMDEGDLSAAINGRLSRLAGRTVALKAQPDALYMRANPQHSVLVPLKQDRQGRRAYVIGMRAPLVISGSEADLRLAWYAGIGEKTRSGFGCIGLIEKGLGR